MKFLLTGPNFHPGMRYQSERIPGGTYARGSQPGVERRQFGPIGPTSTRPAAWPGRCRAMLRQWRKMRKREHDIRAKAQLHTYIQAKRYMQDETDVRAKPHAQAKPHLQAKTQRQANTNTYGPKHLSLQSRGHGQHSFDDMGTLRQIVRFLGVASFLSQMS